MDCTFSLPQDHPWGKRIFYFDTLPSTNTLAKEMAAQGAPEGTVIVAGHQSAGRGRLGRSFESPRGLGLYLSVILRPGCRPQQLMHLTCAAGIAACDGVEEVCGLRPRIKWANDLVWEKQKLGGILTELGFDPQGNVAWAVVGVGINCTQTPEDFPPELRPIAASLSMAAGKNVDRDCLAKSLICQLEKMNRALTAPGVTMARYRGDCITLGQQIRLQQADTVRYGRALDVDDSGGLIVEFSDGQVHTVASGEVSVRGMYGYL